MLNDPRKGKIPWGEKKDVKQRKAPQKAAKEETSQSSSSKTLSSPAEKASHRIKKARPFSLCE